MAFRARNGQRATLDYLIALYTPEIRDVFLAAIQDVVDEAIIPEIIKAIENGDPEAAFRALGFSQAALNPLVAVIERAFERGGVMTGENFPKYLRTPSGRAVFRFDVRNSRSEAFLREHSSELVTRITDETRTNVRLTLERGMLDGRNPRNVALDIVGRIDPNTQHRVGGIVGLAANQEIWVANTRRDLLELNRLVRDEFGTIPLSEFRKKLESNSYFSRELRRKGGDSVILRQLSKGKELDAATVDKLVTAYKNNALRYRGESIGRTEAIHSLNRAEWEAHKQAIDMGALREQDVRRHWDSAGDKRVRWSHKRMDALYDKAGVGIDEPFISPSGARMMHPGDTSLGAPAAEVIMCRCRVRLEVDFLAQWNDEDD